MPAPSLFHQYLSPDKYAPRLVIQKEVCLARRSVAEKNKKISSPSTPLFSSIWIRNPFLAKYFLLMKSDLAPSLFHQCLSSDKYASIDIQEVLKESDKSIYIEFNQQRKVKNKDKM